MARKRTHPEGFAHSLTDLMTSIAVIFILLFLVFVDDKQKEIAEIASQKQQTTTNLEELLKALRQEFSGTESVTLEADDKDPLTLLILLQDNPEFLGFKFNQAAVSSKGKTFLRSFVPKLANVVCSPQAREKVDSVIIEGHTDSKGTDDSNTDLSARRATAVLIESRQILENYAASASAVATDWERCFLRLSRATGRGEQELVVHDVNGLPMEDQDASRRVVVKVRVKSVEQRGKLEDLASEIGDG